ncbi:MAG TPA: iron donor protein CyaY [Candidatus Megaira endosymbiont of Nemacystus decipiens]|nr:iron donor protein CyaY [Candidatus Megaera endosymbiont of Nemacystus decipiens]
MISDAGFIELANEVISKIADKTEEMDTDCNFDIDLNNSILSISGSVGTYVINVQSAANEIWLSSPISGPFHFGYINGQWVSSRGDNLFDILNKELKISIS